MDTKRLRLRDVVLLALCLAACQTPPTTEAAESLTLVQTLIVSRHSIRTPMAAPFSDVGDISAYSTRKWPSAADWGMTQKEVDNQFLTPRGIEVARLTGEFYRETFNSGTPTPISNLLTCDQVTVFSDGGAYRDFQTAQAWLEGFGCPAPEETNIIQINQSSLPTMQPVVATAFQIDGCSAASEEQVNGTYGGNVAALTARFAASIQKVQDVLQMPVNASICTQVNRTFEPSASHPCTLFELGYAWNGVLWDGMFYSPLVYAQYFAEAWMLQYLSNVTQWAWGALSSTDELVELYKMHIQSLWFGTNEWNSRAYGSQLLAYVLASLNAAATGRQVLGLEHEPSQKVVAFFSHDANILYLQRLLGMSWLTTGWPFDVATTASSVRFELLRETTGKLFVRVAYVSASPDQQRSATSFVVRNVANGSSSSNSSSGTPLSVAYVVIPQCGSLLCPLDEFQDAVLAAVDTDCMIGDTQRYAVDLIAAQEPSIILTALVTAACVLFAMSVPLIVIVARTYNGGCGLGKPTTAMSRGHRGVSRNSSSDTRRRVATRRAVGQNGHSAGAEATRSSTGGDDDLSSQAHASSPSESRRRSTRSNRSRHTRRLSSRTPTDSTSADLLLNGSAAQTWPADADIAEQGAVNVQRRQTGFEGAGGGGGGGSSEGTSADRGYRGTRAPSGEFGGLSFDRSSSAPRERSRTRSTTGSRGGGGSANRLLSVPMAQSFSSSSSATTHTHSNNNDDRNAFRSENGHTEGASGADLA